MDEFAAMPPSTDRFGSTSSSPADMHRPRRHLPSPALAQATSLLRLTQTYGGSFDICDLSALHLSLTSSPSAPVVSSSVLHPSGLIGAAGRKLPVPGRPQHHQQHHNNKMSSAVHHHMSQSDLMMASVADAMDEMDALIRPSSGSASVIGARDSPKLSLSRKLPVPPVSAATKVINQSRRLLPRPLSCDVPCVSDADIAAGLQSAAAYLPVGTSQRARSSQLCSRPYSFDYSSGAEAELEEAALLHQQHQRHQQQQGSIAGSDPSLLYLETQNRRSLIRQSSTTSCPALVRPCALSPRSPKYRTADASSFSGSVSGGSSINTTPSPLPLLHPSLLSTTDPTAYVPTGVLVPFTTPSHHHTALPLSIGSSQAVATAGVIIPPRPYLWPATAAAAAAATIATHENPSLMIPSTGSAFRAPPLGPQYRQASLSLPPSGLDPPPPLDTVNNTNTTSSTSASTTSLAMRRHRFHDVGDGGGSFCGPFGEFAHYRLDMQRPSRSRQPVRNSVILAASFFLGMHADVRNRPSMTADEKRSMGEEH
ncbi:hypothetical protein DAPPUDRAFT_95214 [Daphnia pulex]|uniref:Uncharacterized protein n=1 Tax=Daphnia pulex TaxID=6669 RepID=E9FU77_DAPPU|nr:hypothetical protein DAPPUDRAFT_95214 [Daphnia pulex]|eukprot:EFX89498.1 hypothetical protein DAPPUDRAFT_95214 [Daphnia pulex]